MLVWTWDGWGGKCHGAGVTDDENRARRTAAAWMRANNAGTARIEQARATTEVSTLLHGYARTGHGWNASRHPDGSIRWTRFQPRQALPAAS